VTLTGNRVKNVEDDENYDRTNRGKVFQKLLDCANNGQIPIGLLFEGEHASLESLVFRNKTTPPALQDPNPGENMEDYKNLMHSFMG